MKFTALSSMLLATSLAVPSAEANGNNGKGSLRRDVAGALFTMTNSNGASRGNELVMYHRYKRDEDFSSIPIERVPTGGDGQFPPVVSWPLISANDYVFAANLGSNTVSAFTVDLFGAILIDTMETNEKTPASLDYHRGILYVLNGAFDERSGSGDGTPTLTAFEVSTEGTLVPLLSYTRSFSDYENMGGAQVSVSPNGRFLLIGIQGFGVPDSNAGALLVFTLDQHGMPSPNPVSIISGVDFLFGFETAFLRGQTYVYIGSLNDGAVSAYNIDKDGFTTLVTRGVVGPEEAADAALCWLVRSGNYLYGTNFGTHTISSWKINREDGSIALLESVAFDFKSGGPTDALVSDGILYVNLPLDGKIEALEIQNDGSLISSGLVRDGEPFNQLGLAVVDF